MSDFDRDEWMEENNVRQGSEWVSFRGKRPRQDFCDILLQDDREIGPCWPREKDFVDLSSDTDDAYDFSLVTKVRYYQEGFRKDEDDEDEDEEDDEV